MLKRGTYVNNMKIRSILCMALQTPGRPLNPRRRSNVRLFYLQIFLVPAGKRNNAGDNHTERDTKD